MIDGSHDPSPVPRAYRPIARVLSDYSAVRWLDYVGLSGRRRVPPAMAGGDGATAQLGAGATPCPTADRGPSAAPGSLTPWPSVSLIAHGRGGVAARPISISSSSVTASPSIRCNLVWRLAPVAVAL